MTRDQWGVWSVTLPDGERLRAARVCVWHARAVSGLQHARCAKGCV
jgi:hypothetical protein